MQLTPLIAVHMTAALGALATGPVALWARKGRQQRPRLHRAFGHAWVTLMLATALSAAFIRDTRLPNVAGYTPIHLLVVVTLGSLFLSFRCLAKGNIAGHKRIMQNLYLAACVFAGVLTLLPDRFLGHLVLEEWMGLDMAARAHAAAMVGPILSHTPAWAWGLLAALIATGLVQVKDRRATTRDFALPGSWMPMALILSLFALRYGVNVALALQPALGANPAFAAWVTAAYGAFSGIFAGRAARLWRLARRPPRGGAAALSA